MSAAKLVSLVVPVYNEEANLGPFYSAVRELMDSLAGRYECEVVFTDNHSTDQTFSTLRDIARRDSRVRVFRFSRNFGYQRSILTGYEKARGACAIQLDCDLQDPPELIPSFLAKWEEGYHVVYGVRSQRSEHRGNQLVRKVFYRLIDLLSEDHLPHDAGDFRLIDRRVMDELAKIDDQHPYIRGTIATLGFRQIGIPYVRRGRERGVSKFSLPELMGLALDGILSHSTVPLRISTYLGLSISLLTVLAILAYTSAKVFFGRDWPPGFASLTVMILLSISLNALFLGIIGEYLGRIYRQVKKRPLVIIEESIEVSQEPRAGSVPG